MQKLLQEKSSKNRMIVSTVSTHHLQDIVFLRETERNPIYHSSQSMTDCLSLSCMGSLFKPISVRGCVNLACSLHLSISSWLRSGVSPTVSIDRNIGLGLTPSVCITLGRELINSLSWYRYKPHAGLGVEVRAWNIEKVKPNQPGHNHDIRMTFEPFHNLDILH